MPSFEPFQLDPFSLNQVGPNNDGKDNDVKSKLFNLINRQKHLREITPCPSIDPGGL